MNSRTPKRLLIFGASGMLGNAVLRLFAQDTSWHVTGTTRSASQHLKFPDDIRRQLLNGVDVENFDSLSAAFASAKPDVVINCVGVVKQLAEANDPLAAIPINSLLPHRLARLCAVAGARLVHLSTDCVFDGTKGNYTENDRPDAYDLYGRSKLLGEVDYENAVTLRTSIIGRELGSAHSLIDWFLAQDGQVRGFTKAIFSGLPTVELARVIKDYVLPRPHLRGLYHVSAEPTSKYDLLQLVAQAFGKTVEIVPDAKVTIDRSLDSSRFRHETGYQPPSWPELVARLRDFG
ncbi:SDR family oxidoreductase [Mesorhizobium sp. YIM 152430]|uniref:dTDP-4-dehydrorhamnose reductase family protein n=1 Tax=Mesorhizobium sp. YIM 152430 TaxID=3031761 RepID=UPI0023DA491E|nr:SDR family oxidoreductase [Mesorhizobium sp. YIM 152430]MDF1598900.1 SDR family oxidoreductase [Mesorhizobium sp. YIM 152430]